MKKYIILSFFIISILFTKTVAFAANSGSCGSSATWKYADETLTIMGSGDLDFNCDDLDTLAVKHIVIEEGITSINENAFKDLHSVKSVTIPSTMKKIGSSAFYKCDNTRTLYISDLSAWCNIEFGNKSSIPFDDDFYLNSLYLGGELLEVLTIPTDVNKISSFAFYCCKSIKSINIHSGVTDIAPDAFRYCQSLTDITVSDLNPVYSSKDGVLLNKGRTKILSCPRLKSGPAYSVPNGIKEIAPYAFFKNGSIKSIDFPNTLKTIGESAFESCNLQTLTIPDSVTTIGDRAFSLGNNLTYAEIGNGITHLGKNMFESSYHLETVKIGKGITSIGSMAFLSCSHLKTIYLGHPVSDIGYGATIFCANLKTVYINGTQSQFTSATIHSDNGYFISAEKKFFSYVTFVDAQGKVLEEITVDSGSKITLLDTEKLYAFYNDRLFKTPYDFDNAINKNTLIFADPVNISLIGDNKAEAGDSNLVETVLLSADKNGSYLNFTVKFPEYMTLTDVTTKEFAKATENSVTIKNGYKLVNITCLYDYNGSFIPTDKINMPVKLTFAVSETAPKAVADISFTNVCLKGSGTYYLEKTAVKNIYISPKLCDEIEILGESEIDSPSAYAANVLPDYTFNKEIIWSVSNSSVATISHNGILTPLKNGTITITASAKDGSGVSARKTVDVIAYAPIDFLDSDVGVTVKSAKNILTVYVPSDASCVTFTPTFTDGVLMLYDRELWIPGERKTFPVTDDVTSFVISREEVPNMTNCTYTVNIIKTDLTKSGALKTDNGISVKCINPNAENMVIIAVYNNDTLISLHRQLYSDTLSYAIDKPYTHAKVFLWQNNSISPVPSAEPVIVR